MPRSKKRRYQDPDDPKRRYVSVTTALNAEAKPALYRWNGKMAGKRSLDNLDELAARLDPANYRDFYDPKRTYKSAAPYPASIYPAGADRQARKAAEAAYDATVSWLADAAQDYTKARALRGTEIHQLAEDYLNGKPLPDNLTDEQHAMVGSVLRFLDDCHPEFLATELRILNRDEGYAGTMDALLRMPDYPQARALPIVGDWKTGSGPWGEWAKQTAAYAHGTHKLVSVDDDTDRAEPLDEISRALAVAVIITPDTYKITEVRDLDDRYREFLAALAMYRAPDWPFTVTTPIPEQIRRAKTVDALYEIWSQADYLGKWTPSLTALAASRKKELA